ncbi:MAG TPA: CDP-alcohol phosphatidyltransferase family protein [Candidatus Saccharimonadales bacterium]|nr:CDP-alcohol phosphatidyltransferase family protein [Candidatus Saccharimonadales bacterium]
MKAQSLKWLPNVLSASRGILAVPVYISAVQGRWAAGFWLLAAALLTDFFDGLAAKKLNAQTVIGGHIDRVSDWMLSFAGALGLVVGAHILTLWLLVIALPLSAFIGYIKFFTPEGTRVYRLTSVISVVMLFITWSFIVWGYLWQAFGWSWVYPPLTVLLLAIAARLKKHRLKAWFGWLVPRRKTEE